MFLVDFDNVCSSLFTSDDYIKPQISPFKVLWYRFKVVTCQVWLLAAGGGRVGDAAHMAGSVLQPALNFQGSPRGER